MYEDLLKKLKEDPNYKPTEFEKSILAAVNRPINELPGGTGIAMVVSAPSTPAPSLVSVPADVVKAATIGFAASPSAPARARQARSLATAQDFPTLEKRCDRRTLSPIPRTRSGVPV